MTVRHYLEFSNNRFAEPTRTADYEEYKERAENPDEFPDLDAWVKLMSHTIYKGNAGRVRIFKITREELDFSVPEAEAVS